ncbi:MAG: hypothetical protein KAS32_13050 [Candidatus Peribacteraceae bacterium]|nr:hypothetical protein [Candidatus Peribacteraceae bacterium]
MAKKPSILIAIPHTGNTVTGLERKLCKWFDESGYDGEFYFSQMNPTYSNRNSICKYFLKKTNHTHLLFIDSDTVPFDNPFNLVKRDKPVVGGVYPMWKIDHFEWLAMVKRPDGQFRTTPERKGLVEVEGLGAGCMLIKREVFKGIKAPFADLVREDGTRSVGHDYAFCQKVRKKGFKVYADWEVLCDHVKLVPLMTVVKALKKSYDEGIKIGKKQGDLTEDIL